MSPSDSTRRYGDTFVVPQPDIKKDGARIMALDDPTKKMSKSAASAGSYIALTDPPDQIRKKIKRAVTDSGSEITASADKPAVTNLLSIYSLFSGRSVSELEADYDGKGYGALKGDLAEVVVEALHPIQERFAELEADPSVAQAVLDEGAERARAIASAKMTDVRDRMGLTQHQVTH